MSNNLKLDIHMPAKVPGITNLQIYERINEIVNKFKNDNKECEFSDMKTGISFKIGSMDMFGKSELIEIVFTGIGNKKTLEQLKIKCEELDIAKFDLLPIFLRDEKSEIIIQNDDIYEVILKNDYNNNYDLDPEIIYNSYKLTKDRKTIFGKDITQVKVYSGDRSSNIFEVGIDKFNLLFQNLEELLKILHIKEK
jgi:hypothetical protein